MLPDPIFLNVHMYGVMIAVGVFFALLLIYAFGRRMHLSEKFLDFIFYNGVFSILFGFGAAALFQALYNYISDPEKGFRITGGITFIGGLIGGAAFFLVVWFFFRRRLDGRLTDILNLVPCCITIAHGFGRIGCFFAGCCYGIPTDFFLAVKFPHLPVPVHPTQLYEAAFLFLLFALLSYLLLRRKFRYNMSVYLVSYGVFRFLIEYLRGDARGSFVSGISPSQFWSILMVAGGIALFFVLRFLEKKATVSCPAGICTGSNAGNDPSLSSATDTADTTSQNPHNPDTKGASQ